ncbi:MAG: hypothetical protein GYA39_02130 [Methanothrix sp.]|nr:hypothetical protein [Methanothrix sp.]
MVHESRSSQELHRSYPLSRAQILMVQSGGPPPLAHPAQQAFFTIHSRAWSTAAQSMISPPGIKGDHMGIWH